MAGVDYLYEFSAYVAAQTGTVIGKSLFADTQPDATTGRAIFLFAMPGGMPGYTYSTNTIRAPRFRVEVRSTAPAGGDYPDITATRNLAQTAWTACMKCNNLSLASTVSHSTGKWLSALPTQDPYLAGRDARNRVVYGFDVAAERMSG